jgi:drug/metabolite transporter (DMT)-like permease
MLAPFQYTQMLWGTTFGYLMFRELPNQWTVLGSLVIIASGLYILWRETVVGHRIRPASKAPR